MQKVDLESSKMSSLKASLASCYHLNYPKLDINDSPLLSPSAHSDRRRPQPSFQSSWRSNFTTVRAHRIPYDAYQIGTAWQPLQKGKWWHSALILSRSHVIKAIEMKRPTMLPFHSRRDLNALRYLACGGFLFWCMLTFTRCNTYFSPIYFISPSTAINDDVNDEEIRTLNRIRLLYDHDHVKYLAHCGEERTAA